MMKTPQQIVNLHERGVITKLEMLVALMQTIHADNVADVMAGASAKLASKIEEYVKYQPTSEVGWAESLSIHGGVIPRSDITEEQQKAINEEMRRRHRRGVEALRDWFAKR